MPIESDVGEGAMARMKDRLSRFETEEGRRKGLRMTVRPSDIFIVTTPKSGTTWMQQITHQLRMKGDEDFAEISEVVPWVELAHDQGQDLEANQKTEPRLFKTHCWYPHVPKGGARYIVVVRNPEEVVVSFFKFFQGWFFEPGEIAFEDFVREFILRRGKPTSEMQNASYWHHLASWVERKDEPTVSIFFYEDLKADLRGSVEQVARAMGYQDTDADWSERISAATERSTFEWMSSHASLFDEYLSKDSRNVAMGLPRDAGKGNVKIRAGGVDAKHMLTDELIAELREKWADIVTPALGYRDYNELRTALSWMTKKQDCGV